MFCSAAHRSMQISYPAPNDFISYEKDKNHISKESHRQAGAPKANAEGTWFK
jgi:hypothetical protein